jgi:hypothetical protein
VAVKPDTLKSEAGIMLVKDGELVSVEEISLIRIYFCRIKQAFGGEKSELISGLSFR